MLNRPVFWFLVFSAGILSAGVRLSATGQSGFFNVRDLGAAADGTTYDTRIVQQAIDSATASGGGTIYFPPGKYILKTIILKDKIRLLLDNGAIILGSTELDEFKPEYGSFKDSAGRKFGSALLFAKDAKDIAVEGNGTIDGQGYLKYYPGGENKTRPSIIRFIGCKKVRIAGVKLVNSAAWVQHYVRCEDLTIKDVTVNSYSNKNNDGLDIESCTRVYVSGCNINSEDDSIVLKAFGPQPCKDVVISDCIISGLKSAIKTGTESLGGFENITISNCTIYGTRGINILSVDGGGVNNITVSNISMRDTYGVIVLRLGDRMRPYSTPENERPGGPGTFCNIMISNVQAVGVTESNDFISGISGHNIENVTLDNIRIEYAGGGKSEDSERKIPEKSSSYPKAKMFGSLPSYGLYIRHVQNVSLENLSLSYLRPDKRSVIKIEQAEKILLDGISAQSNPNAAPFIWLNKCKDVNIRRTVPSSKIDTFLRADSSKEILLVGNKLSGAVTPIQPDAASKNEIKKMNNF